MNTKEVLLYLLKTTPNEDLVMSTCGSKWNQPIDQCGCLAHQYALFTGYYRVGDYVDKQAIVLVHDIISLFPPEEHSALTDIFGLGKYSYHKDTPKHVVRAIIEESLP